MSEPEGNPRPFLAQRKQARKRVETVYELPISKLGIAKRRSNRRATGSSLNCGKSPENRGLTKGAVTNSPEIVTARCVSFLFFRAFEHSEHRRENEIEEPHYGGQLPTV